MQVVDTALVVVQDGSADFAYDYTFFRVAPHRILSSAGGGFQLPGVFFCAFFHVFEG
jgi:hypothetical protein